MDNNDFIRRVRYALQIDDAKAARLIELGGGRASVEETAAWRLKESDAGYLACTDAVVATLLAGLIIDRRSGDAPVGGTGGSKGTTKVASGALPAPSADAINNQRLKQLRIALSMRSDDVEAALKAGGSGLSSSEVAALFRKPGARNFRRCGDQSLRHFLTGLTKSRADSTADARPTASSGNGIPSPWPSRSRR